MELLNTDFSPILPGEILTLFATKYGGLWTHKQAATIPISSEVLCLFTNP